MRQLLKDKKGTTLVELLVALAILGIVLVWVATFMITGSKLFSSTGSQSNVQNEVQMVENRTADLLKETQLGVSLAVIQNNVTTFVTNDAGYTNADEKCVFMFNWNSNQNAVEARMIRWNKEDKKVYLSPSYVVENATVENELGNTVSANILQAMSDINVTWEPLAERITEFSVDMTGYAQKNSIHIYAKAEQQGKSYDGEVNTVIRNNIILNASSINELYERAGHIVSTVIKAINLSTSGSSTIPSGRVQLSTMVTGEGYPSQIIYKWKIVKVEAGSEVEVIFDSSTGASADTYVDTTTKVLNVADSMEAAILRIYAYSDTRSNDEDYVNETVEDKSKVELVYNAGGSIKTILIYDYVDISIRNIESFTVQPTPDLSLDANKTLKDLVNDFAAITMTTPGDIIPPGVMDVYPGNVIPMSVSITGRYLTDEDKSVYWTLEDETGNIAVTLSENGVLLVNRYSNAGRCVITAHSTLDSRVSLSYVVNIGDAFAEGNNILEIVSDGTINRSGTAQLGLKLNGETVPTNELQNFNWSVNVTNSAGVRITNNPATLSSSGFLRVSDSLSYDYLFNVNITVSMKNNQSIYATKHITIPRVSVTLSCSTYLSERGKTIPYGEITANVIGLERGSYRLSWSLAKETNPTYYVASYTSGTNVSADRNDDRRCRVVISGSESESLTYIRLKVTINGHSNYTALCRIVLTTVDIRVECNKSTIYRDNSGTNKAVFTASSTQTSLFSPSEIRWEIDSVAIGTSVIKKYNGLVLTKTATGAELYALDTFYPSTDDISVTVKASWGSFSSTHTITVTKISFNITGATTINRGDTLSLSASSSFGSNIEWSVTSISNGNASDYTLTPSGSHYLNSSLALKASYDTGNHSGDKIVVTAHVANTNLTATHTINVSQVAVTITKSAKYAYSASVSGLTGYSGEWKLATSEGGALSNSITGVTMTTSGDSVTLNVSSGAPAKFYLYYRATKSGTTFTSSSATVTTISLSSTPSSLSYSGTYTCQFAKQSNYYSYQLTGGRSALKDDVYYYKARLGYKKSRWGSWSYDSYVYYAYDTSSGTWYIYESSTWNEVASNRNIGSTSYKLLTILQYMANKTNYNG